MKILFIISILALGAFANKLQVTVSIVPQQYFVQKIAQDKIDVNVMVKPGFSPATYEPKTSQMKELANSIAYFSIGVPFENVWIERFSSANKNLNIVDTTKGITKLSMQEHFHDEADENHTHHDEKESNHEENENHEEHEGLDPHVWLDPLLVKIQAKIIFETLCLLDKPNALFYKTNYEAFVIELDELYLELKNILIPVENKAFMVFHPSWGYFAHRFALEQIAVEVSGKEPKPNQLVELIQEAKKHNIKTVFVAPEFSQRSAKVIASSIGGAVFVVSPLQLKWRENLIFAANSIVDSYK